MLIAYQDLLKFNVIHANFPYKVLTHTVTADILAEIKHCFSDVLGDDLNLTPMKTPTPMIISLKERSWQQGEYHDHTRSQQRTPSKI